MGTLLGLHPIAAWITWIAYGIWRVNDLQSDSPPTSRQVKGGVSWKAEKKQLEVENRTIIFTPAIGSRYGIYFPTLIIDPIEIIEINMYENLQLRIPSDNIGGDLNDFRNLHPEPSGYDS